MTLKNRITELEKRVDVLEGKMVVETPMKVNMRSIGWSYKKSKNERESAIVKGVMEKYGARPLYDEFEKMRKMYKVKAAIEACKEAKSFILQHYKKEYDYNLDPGGELEIAKPKRKGVKTKK